MYVCICNGITERQVLEAIEHGATSLSDLNARLGVASGCGTCAAFTIALLELTRQPDCGEQYSEAA